MQEYAGSVVSQVIMTTEGPDSPPSFLTKFTSFFKFGGASAEENKNQREIWREFPWEDIMIKTDLIKKWS